MSLLPPPTDEEVNKKVMFPHMGEAGTVHRVGTGEAWKIFFMSQMAVRGTLGGRILLYLWNAPYEKLASDELTLSLMEVRLQFNSHQHRERTTSILPRRQR